MVTLRFASCCSFDLSAAMSGFICIEQAGYAADDALASWVRRGLDFASGLPAKPVRTSG
jgi:hypothetical protein